MADADQIRYTELGIRSNSRWVADAGQIRHTEPDIRSNSR